MMMNMNGFWKPVGKPGMNMLVTQKSQQLENYPAKARQEANSSMNKFHHIRLFCMLC